jgi:3-hydroxyacyl-CoA dehydrogenase
MASVVSTSRFKTLLIKKKTKISIKNFVEENKLSFKKGRGFYQLTKPEVIQDYKEVIVRRKSDGAFLTGDKVKEVLSIPKSAKKFKLDLDEITDFDVFVQSTSVNRVLLPDTEFLYEVDDDVSCIK